MLSNVRTIDTISIAKHTRDGATIWCRVQMSFTGQKRILLQSLIGQLELSDEVVEFSWQFADEADCFHCPLLAANVCFWFTEQLGCQESFHYRNRMLRVGLDYVLKAFLKYSRNVTFWFQNKQTLYLSVCYPGIDYYYFSTSFLWIGCLCRIKVLLTLYDKVTLVNVC